MRTKEEIAAILAKRKFPDALNASTWDDLVAAIQVYTPEEKDIFVKLIVSGNSKKVGDRLKKALSKNAMSRAVAEVDLMLSDDMLSLTEIDNLL